MTDKLQFTVIDEAGGEERLRRIMEAVEVRSLWPDRVRMKQSCPTDSEGTE